MFKAVRLGQQTTAMLRPIDARVVGPQQTERMAPYRPEADRSAETPSSPVQSTERMAPVPRATSNPSAGPVFTVLGTEIMAPFRAAPSLSSSEAPSVVATPPIVPATIVAITIVPPARARASSPLADQAADRDTTLFEVPAVPAEQRSTDGRNREATPTAVDVRSPIPRGRDETPRGVAKTRHPASVTVSWLAKLGLLAKARPVLVACGAMAGAFVLAAVLLATTRMMGRHETRPAPAAKASATHSVTPPTAVASASPTPIQIVETPPTVRSGGATRPPSSPAKKKTPNDPELAAAVADVLAGRYSEARVAYAALSHRPGNTATYASLARLLARAEDPECLANGQGAPKDCPGVHR